MATMPFASVPLASLWLPIILSAVIVFIASSIMHMVLPYHHGDYKKLPEEEKTLAALRGVARGLYMFPHCSHKDMNTPEMIKKWETGPAGVLTIFPLGRPAMPKFLGQWFGFCLLVNFFIAYLAAHTLPTGTHYLQVFRVVGTAGFLAYGLSNIINGIWKGQPWGMVIKEVIDGLIYGLLVAGTFGWLWPR
jgi:hypothetical protein